jgi:glycerol-3-phosphate O-acyltransferase
MAFWQTVRRALGSRRREDRETALADVVGLYATSVVGSFQDRVFDFARRVVPPAMALVLGNSSPKLLFKGVFRDLDSVVTIDGDTEALRRVAERGTVLIAPTRQSTLDPVLVSWSLNRLGIPPVLYPAASNLFDVPIFGRLIRSLGGYRVDGRRNDRLYTDVLREYAVVSMELGYHNMVFPGGARSRTGAIDPEPQLELLGTALAAFENCLATGSPRRVFVVPVVLSYRLILEAEWLIEDHLRDQGRGRYLITEDEFPRPRRLADFAMNAFSLDARVVVTFGAPLDPFGNPVDAEGRSIGPSQKPVAIERYVCEGGELERDVQRDAEYTRELGKAVRRAQLRGDVLYSTHVLSRAVINLFRRRFPGIDVFAFLRACAREPALEQVAVHEEVDRVITQLRGLASAGMLQLDASIEHLAAEEVVRDALRYFGSYHSRPAVRRTGTDLLVTAPNVMLFYANRLEGHDLDA